jgi:neutral ceramidase
MTPDSLLASAVEIDITPPVGTGFDGYAARQGNSLGIHDPLLGQLILLESGKEKMVLISLDLLGTSLDFTQQVRQGITQAIEVPEDGTMVTCSHTHSGAAGFLPHHPGITSFQDPDLQGWVIRKLVGAAIWAEQLLQPAYLGIGHGSMSGIGLNRNDPEEGLVDQEVIVLRIENQAGKPMAVMMNYGCHPTVLGYQNLYYSADFPGATRATLRQIYPETTFLFTNGASGDISTRFTRRDQSFDEVERMGRLLAGEVLKIMQEIKVQPKAELQARTSDVDLKFRPIPSREDAQAELEELQDQLEALKASGASHGEIRKAITRVEGATGQVQMAEEISGRSSNRSQMQMLSIGDLGLVGVPGEPFTHTVLDIKAESPRAFTGVISYANDYQGYFPDAHSIQEGSYEALISPYGAEVADTLANTAKDLLKNE